ncbi:MAG: DUF2798 domain-containing protein [Rickettsiales bacterium]|jgi:hypothetical protein|nr:DUF2798 domain-containing protein [Rickettsiales bacterium]
MAKFIHLVPQVYMILSMTLSISFIHYMAWQGDDFWGSWIISVAIAAPLAFFFSFWIKPIMKKLGGQAW